MHLGSRWWNSHGVHFGQEYAANARFIPIPSGEGVWVNSLKISKKHSMYVLYIYIHIHIIPAPYRGLYPYRVCRCQLGAMNMWLWATRAKSASAVKCKYTRPAAFLQSSVVIRGKFVGIFKGGGLVGCPTWNLVVVVKWLGIQFHNPPRIHGMNGIFSYIYHKNQPNVGKLYQSHGSYG